MPCAVRRFELWSRGRVDGSQSKGPRFNSHVRQRKLPNPRWMLYGAEASYNVMIKAPMTCPALNRLQKLMVRRENKYKGLFKECQSGADRHLTNAIDVKQVHVYVQTYELAVGRGT